MNTDAIQTPREQVLQAMRARPQDPWPRGTGHVVLGTPGSPRAQKAYHEPGGSFSPAPGSFGISWWIVGADGRRVATSDDLPLAEITQSWERQGDGVPTLCTQTPFYDCRWTQMEEGRWRGTVRFRTNAGAHLALLLRSVGPAGAPVDTLDWDGRQLLVNHRWVVRFEPASAPVLLGDEAAGAGMAEAAPLAARVSAAGWCFARVDGDPGQTLSVVIRDTAPLFASPLSPAPVRSGLQLDLPDRAFVDSLEAQAAHLLMGFIGQQTCPGEPTNYPLAWERDGAYAVMAMARCGQLTVARQLARYFAENDFFGGFGAEGDAPGSSIQAIVSVALLAGDDSFLQEIWPHVLRKAGLIEEMLGARDDRLKAWLGPIVPLHQGKPDIPVICRPAQDGLIVGSMDLHFPVLYISAFSRRGLILAAELAARLGHDAEARRWRGLAAGIRAAWGRHFSDPAYHNERTFMSALWPTWMADPDDACLRQGLQQRWETVHGDGCYPTTPLWTYFTVAEAHQWLFLNRPDRVWQTLRYFWEHQCSPGLYTYWEGEGEENTFREWENLRGWVRPPHVTPHYWTASEMLLLQLDMLAYVDESKEVPALVIGAGVPAAWAGHAMQVSGMPTRVGVIDWTYRDGKLEVVVHGSATPPVRAGSGFGQGVRVNVRKSC